jgi:C_GCAxxG_C_C family probable redox protein
MNKAEMAADLFFSGLNCAQSILSAFGDPYGIDLELAATLGRSLGGGVGRTGRTCGAVMGAALLIGMVNTNPDETEAKKEVAFKVQEFMRQFEAIHKSCECKNLLGADISTAEGLKKIQDENLFRQLCPTFVKDAARLLEQMLATLKPACGWGSWSSGVPPNAI